MPFLTNMMNQAYSMWDHLGRGPQSQQTIESFLMEDGFVIHTEQNPPCATLCLRDTHPEIKDGWIYIHRAHRVDDAKLYEPKNFSQRIQGKKLNYFYGLSVDPSMAQSGLGRAAIDHCFQESHSAGYDGMMLETGEGCGWLIQWYQRLGFVIVGEGVLVGTQVKTVMMAKWYGETKDVRVS